jgi:hypothetical protein
MASRRQDRTAVSRQDTCWPRAGGQTAVAGVAAARGSRAGWALLDRHRHSQAIAGFGDAVPGAPHGLCLPPAALDVLCGAPWPQLLSPCSYIGSFQCHWVVFDDPRASLGLSGRGWIRCNSRQCNSNAGAAELCLKPCLLFAPFVLLLQTTASPWTPIGWSCTAAAARTTSTWRPLTRRCWCVCVC